MNNRIISEYLESLKEDDELDYIFPILLESMGFRIVSTPKNSKGQPQYGKDIVAIGEDENHRTCRWYFELKGNAAKDINEQTFNCSDGVRESILAAKDVEYSDSSIRGFNSLPTIIVFVHNGVIRENTRTQFEGFIKREFPNEGFERWGIEKLINLFSLHLFDECLFRDEDSYRLVKRILVMYDAPGWDISDFSKLVDIQLSNCDGKQSNSRELRKCFSAIGLMLAILLKEGQRTDNYLPAKKASDIAVLRTWAWILRNNKTQNKKILQLYNSIIRIHLRIYGIYLDKLIPLATQYKGLYMVEGLETERIFYPIRCFDFICDVVYYYTSVRNYLSGEDLREFDEKGVHIVSHIIRMNSGFDIPLLDTNSIAILLVIKYLTNFRSVKEELDSVIADWIAKMIVNIIIRKQDDDMFPELYGSKRELAKSLFKKSSNYQDKSSLLLTIFAELLYWIDAEELYEKLHELITRENTNLQIAYPIELPDLEERLFTKHLHEEMSVETSIKLPDNLHDLPQYIRKDYSPIELETSKTPFHFIIFLAHIHYQTDWFPDFVDFGFLSTKHRSSDNKRSKE